MHKTEETPRPLDPHSIQKIETHIQDKINSGYTAPRGWLFRGLTFFFPSSHQANGDANSDSDSDSSNFATKDIRLTLARNTAQFGGASIVTSLKTHGVTHVIVNTEMISSAEISSLRKSLADGSRKKIPHLVSLDWVEESWEHGTLLDEESKFILVICYTCSFLWRFDLGLLLNCTLIGFQVLR
jgi:DNA ligase-4